MIKMFAAKMAGGVNDPDDLVVDAFKAFDEEVEEKIKGQIVKRHVLEKDNFVHILTAFGDKLTVDELDDIFGEFVPKGSQNVDEVVFLENVTLNNLSFNLLLHFFIK